MTDNVALIIVAGVTGIPAVINAVSSSMVRRAQHKMAEADAEMKTEMRAQSTAVKETKVEVLVAKDEVIKVHALVNSQMTQMRADLDAANERIADLIAKLPGRINGGHKE